MIARLQFPAVIGVAAPPRTPEEQRKVDAGRALLASSPPGPHRQMLPTERRILCELGRLVPAGIKPATFCGIFCINVFL